MAINAGSVSVDIVPNAAGFSAKLNAAIRNAQVQVQAVLDDTGIRRQIEELSRGATASIRVDLNDSGVRSKLDELARNRSATVNVNADSGEAAARIDEVARNRKSTVNVDADTGAARAEISSLGSAADGSSGGLRALAVAGISLGPAIIPVAAAAAAAVAGIGVGAVGAVGGLGVLAAAIIPIVKAVTDQRAAQQGAAAAATAQAAAHAAAAARIASAQDSLKSAEASLANTRANGAASAQRAAQAVIDAQSGVRTATIAAAQGVATAIAQEAVAERGLQSALLQETQAQRALSAARVQAKRDLEDLTASVADGALAQRQAAIDVESAKAALDQLGPTQKQIADATRSAANAAARYQIIMSNPKSTALQRQAATAANDTAKANLANVEAAVGGSKLQREQAQLTYDQAVQHQKELSTRQKRLVDDQKAAAKAGVNGAPGVKNAQQGVKDAQQGVLDARQKVAQAEKAIDDARVAGAQRIAAAERSLADARTQQSNQARQNAFSVSQAQERVLSSERALAQARASDTEKTNSALQKAKDSMAALTGPGRELATLISGTLIPGFVELANIAQAPLATGIIAGLREARPILPVLRDLFQSIGGALGDLAENLGKSLGSPFWVSFFRLVERTAGPAISGLATFVGNLARGLAGLSTAFAPVGAAVGRGLLDISKKFADFGTGKGNGLSRFVDYIKTEGPGIAANLGSIALGAGHIVVALAPLGGRILDGVARVFDYISGIPADQIGSIATNIVAVVLAVKALSVAPAIIGGVSSALSFLALGPVAVVVAAIAVLAGGFVLAYQHSKTFRDFINDKLLPGLQAVGQFVLAYVGPAFSELGTTFRSLWETVAPIISDLFTTLVRLARENMPTIKAIFTAILDIIVGIVQLISADIKRTTALISFIWSHWGGQITAVIKTVFPAVLRIIKGVLDQIAGVVQFFSALVRGDWSGMWAAIKRIAKGFLDQILAVVQLSLSVVRGVFGDLIDRVNRSWNNFWDGVRSKASSAMASVKTGISRGLDTVRNAFRTAVDAIGTIWAKIQDIAKAPVKFIVQTVLENGILAAFRRISTVLDFDPGKNLHVNLPKGFHDGGWTGPGSKYQPAGVVHADEFVINKASRRRIEQEAPGYLDHLNQYASGGLVKLGADGGGGGHVNWKGGTFSRLFLARLQQAQDLAHVTFNVFQGGFRPATSYSGTSHAGDAVDLGPVLGSVVQALRQVGIAAWRRGPAQGFSLRHIHGVPTPGNGYAGGQGIWQAQDYLRGGDGLGGRDYEARTGVIKGLPSGGGALGSVDGVPDTSGLLSKVKNSLKGLSQLGDSPFVKMVEGIPRKIASVLESKVSNLASKFVIGTADPKAGFGTTGTNRERGRSLMKQYGFADAQWPSLEKLWTRESDWNEKAVNASSGAYGIPQALPGNKMASVAADWRANPNTQIMWGLKYIKDRYGNPDGAWAHSERVGWYDNGGWLKPGTTVVHNDTGKPEAVFTNPQFERLVKGLESVGASGKGGGPTVNFNGDISDPDLLARAVVTKWNDAISLGNLAGAI